MLFKNIRRSNWLNNDFTSKGHRSVPKSCPTLYDPMDCSMPGFPVLHYLLEFAQTHLHWVCDAINHLVLCHPLFLLPSIFPSIRVFSSELAFCLKWPKYWVLTLNMSKTLTHHQGPITPSLKGSAPPWREEKQDSQMNTQEIVNSTNIGAFMDLIGST